MEEGAAEDRKGSIVQKFAIISILIIVASTFAGASVERMANAGGLPSIALLEPNQYVATKNADAGGVDFTPTGSISGRIVLNPCNSPSEAP
jgi:hypothetical protein